MRASGTGDRAPSGLLHGIGAYAIWGLLPIYFKLLPMVGPLEMVANRIMWSLLFMALLLTATASLTEFRETLRNRRVMLTMAASATLIALNWLVYIWAVGNGHIIAASLGYFLNPLINVLLGVFVLKEQLRKPQAVAIGIAAVGVAILAFAARETLWVSLILALTFAFYGLIRKTAPIGPRQGLSAETLILCPLAGGYLLYLMSQEQLIFGENLSISLLMAFSGIVTSLPLLLFATAARRMPLSALGLLQYLAPTLQFLVGVILYDEKLGSGQLVSFGLIWTGLILFTIDSIRHARATQMAELAVTEALPDPR